MHDLETIKARNDAAVAKAEILEKARKGGPVPVKAEAPMREAKLLVPQPGYFMDPAHDVINVLRERLIEEFGGVTELPSIKGWWRDPEDGQVAKDPLIAFVVAAEDTVQNHNLLYRIADKVRKDLGEKKLYAQFFDGSVRLV